MSYIKGKFRQIIYQNSENGYLVSLFRVKEASEDYEEYENKTITVTGTIADVKLNLPYTLEGEITNHPKYSWQFSIKNYTFEKPTTKDSIIEFLASPFIEGCGEKLAQNIVDVYGEKSLDKIKKDVNNLFNIKGMTAAKAIKIYNSVLKFEKNDEDILRLKNMGFTIEDTAKIITKHQDDIEVIKNENVYLLKDLFDFPKLDSIYCNNFDKNSDLRCKECILNTMMQISFGEGSIHYTLDEISKNLKVLHNITVDNEVFLSYIDDLIKNESIIKEGNNYYLEKYYNEEKYIAKKLYTLASNTKKRINKINDKITEFEENNNIIYNDEQKKAIKEGLSSNISIISGGPGTGKTTIINAIVKIYADVKMYAKKEITENIALLAPTGRASKKLSLSTGFPAYTIHRHLKWHKETDTFEYDENNHIPQKLIIVDETSMIDVSLMYSLLNAISDNSRVILVGDIYQLPSVGPGLILQDLINSDYFTYTPLSIIYRQSDNSYIPYLAKDIKNQNIDEEFMYKRDDYNFIPCEENEILSKVVSSCKYGLTKDIDETKMQVLAPMYKGINGIDNLNMYLQKIYNPPEKNKTEIKYGEKIFRENDKVLQLVNDADNNVFNGDIGKIIAIYKEHDGKTKIDIDFDGNYVSIEKKDLKNITHAYAISIHKSQGSEFDHVIMPVCKSYFIMLYNKLLYTGVSRAKKSLTIIGQPRSFVQGIQNNYSKERKTSLIKNLDDEFNREVKDA